MATYPSATTESEITAFSSGDTRHATLGPVRLGEYGDRPPSKGQKLRYLRDPLSITLVIVILLALGVAALLSGELYVRHRASSVLAKVVECEVKDQASVSFGVRPILLELMTGNYSDISIDTAGNRLGEAKGMKMDLQINDLRLHGNYAGTLGSLDAHLTWSSEGITQTLQDTIPIFGRLVTGVTTKPSDGTIELQGGLGSITTRPQIANGGLALRVLNVTGLGFTLPRETVQPALDAFTSTMTKNLPMGIHPDSVQVTDRGVSVKFSTRAATIPARQTDPCLAGL
jgi:hypothetical protein